MNDALDTLHLLREHLFVFELCEDTDDAHNFKNFMDTVICELLESHLRYSKTREEKLYNIYKSLKMSDMFSSYFLSWSEYQQKFCTNTIQSIRTYFEKKHTAHLIEGSIKWN